MELVVSPINRTLNVKAGANLLDVLRQNDVPVSYSCMAGRCGTCRCKVLKGKVLEAGGHESQTPMVTGDRFVLACQTVLAEDCTIEIPEPDEVVVHPARIAKATVVAIEDLTHDVKRLLLQLPKPLSYSPGQYVQLQVGTGLVRPYSMAGVGADGTLEFHIRIVPDGRCTQHIAKNLQPGAALRVTGPLGTAYLRRNHAGPMICIAGSTGLAPILSIVRGALAHGMTNPIHVYFGVRAPRDLYGEEWLRELAAAHSNLKLHVVITTGNEHPGRRSGLVTEAVAADWADANGARAYVCGPPAMVEATTLLLQQRGVPRDHIYADAFYPTGT
ncbi:FAD-binding oxidoreductase [Steroidobacter sp.]|uniref:FAD-binding oxidoreductase n=1 Tax=Steroidobacter sp. TaxID=1978227 RepID=UPI001A59AB78|nr:2Fe-2S iron-sulfur cluster-binding protein [Steroidobacter sp.]MBL8266815.1 2Fe-2S iron-sulfur cluster binding domain-containing protein [Steroidobacter sp.]